MDEWLDDDDTRRPKMEFGVTVLTTGFWPTYKFTELALPEECVGCVSTFKEFYEKKLQHRKLTWIYGLGQVSMKGNFSSKPIELNINLFQAAILLLFNEQGSLKYTEIRDRLGLPDEDMARNLHSLSCAKYKILLKEPAGKTVS